MTLQINTDRRQYINFSQLMTFANKAASALLKKNRKVIEMAKERQKKYPSVQILSPRKLTWGECLSQALKELYSESHVVPEVTGQMAIHNVFYRKWEEPTSEQMQEWQSKGIYKNYTGD